MDEKKYKRLVTIIIILLSIIVLMAGYIVYDVITSSNNKLSKNDIVDVPNKDNGSQEKENEEPKEMDFDLDKANQLLENIDYNSFFDMPEDISIDLLKLQVAFDKAKSQSATCDSIYANLAGVKKEEWGYEIDLDNVDFDTQNLCQYSTKVTTFKDVEETYKKLFGKTTLLTKKDIGGYSYCDGNYDYIESLDSFVLLNHNPDGCFSTNKEVNVIKSAKAKDNQLTIEVYRTILEWNGHGGYEATLGNEKVTFEQSKVEEESFEKGFFEQYSQYMSDYKFVFELEDDNYIFKTIA